MNLIKILVVWVVVAALSFLLSRWPGRVLPPDINSAVLIAIGAISSLTNAFSMQVLRRLDEPPVKDLTPTRAGRVYRIYGRRRISFIAKWVMAVVLGICGAIGGLLMKVPSLKPQYDLILSFSYIALGLAITFGILIVLEYVALSRIARDLPRELEERKRREELLARLKPIDPKPVEKPHG